MDRLYRVDVIERGFLWRADRKDRSGLREKCADPRADPAPSPCADPAPTPAPTATTHTLYTTYIEAGLQTAAPSHSEDDVAWSATTLSVDDDDGLYTDGNIVGWNDEGPR